MNQVRYMPIDDIVVTNPYLRLDTGIEELKKSIRAVGLIHPLIVSSTGMLLAGGRRYAALRSLGIEQVPVVVVDLDDMMQELISIDENLMRLPLNTLEMEQALNRGREIYESIYPTAKKVDLSSEGLERKPPRSKRDASPSQDAPPPEPPADIEDGKSSYVEVTAQKTGLSEGAIRSAILRQTRSSEQVRAARVHGELGAGQANELVKLDPSEQDKLLPLVKDRPTKAIRKIVSEAQTLGVDAIVQKVAAQEPLPKEYEVLIGALEKVAKVGKQITRKKLRCPEDEQERLDTLLESAIQALEQIRDA